MCLYNSVLFIPLTKTSENGVYAPDLKVPLGGGGGALKSYRLYQKLDALRTVNAIDRRHLEFRRRSVKRLYKGLFYSNVQRTLELSPLYTEELHPCY